MNPKLFTGEKFMGKHLNIGDQVAQTAGISYRIRIDNYVKIVRGVKFYAGYMDDSYAIHESKEFLQELLEDIIEIANELGITVNTRKTRICKLSEHWRFLQVQYSLTDTGRVIQKINPKRLIGYFDFINIPNYKNLKGVTDPRKYLENIKADGYATSHKYVDNLMRVIETWQLTDYDKKEETKMSNSPLVVYTKLSPNHSGQRTHSIDRITPHCVVGQLSAESICGCFISTSRQASCNYGIGTDGRISMSVEEKNRSWCSSSRENDQRAVTIECASDKTAPYAFNDAVYASLVNLCVDICQRNGKSKLLWLGDKDKTLAYAPKSDEMVLTVHRWFANKSCPGDWLYNRLGNLAAEVTKRLTGGSTDTGKVDVPSDGKTLYRVQTGAFSKRSNADAWAAKLKAAGFDTYIVQMDNLYKVQVGAYSQKSNAENMMAKLKAAGYDAFITTKSGTAAGTAKKSAAEIAKEIYNGTCSDARWSSWGNGADRVNRLKQAGYDPSEVQSEVNKLF